MLTIERMYELAHRAAHTAPTHPACDHDDLVQCAVIGMVQASVVDEAMATVVARRRIIDEIRRFRGRQRTAARPGRSAVHDATYLFRPLPGFATVPLADTLPEDDDEIARIENRLDAGAEAPRLLRAVGRRAGQVLVWHIVEGRSMTEIALRCGVTESRISQITNAALARARAAHDARSCSAPPLPRPGRRDANDRGWLEATPTEKRAFGEFRRLQRAGLRRQEALAALPEEQRLLVAEYQRKCQRRARARAAGEAVPKQPPRSQQRYATVDEIVITPGERAAAASVWRAVSRGARWRHAIRALDPVERALAESYNVKMRARSRVRARLAAADQTERRTA